MYKLIVIVIVSVLITSMICVSFAQEVKKSNDSLNNHPDLLFEYKIAELSRATPIELEYNEDIRNRIYFYTTVRKHDFEEIIGLSKIYFPIIEEYLDKYDLPLELKYIPVIESGLNPLARSKSGAVGIWQFLLNTCNLFDLEVNSYIDDRRDIYKSTEAACKYLSYLYNTFHDWQLVMTAYNGGPGEVRKAIERSGGKTGYWEIKQYLSEEAANYYPSFIAAMYVLNNYTYHGLKPVEKDFGYSKLDTLYINYELSFSQISEITGITMEILRDLNPAYKKDFIPNLEKPSILVLPADKIEIFLRKEINIISTKNNVLNYNDIVLNAGDKNDKVKIIHVVKKGEFFHKIALKYGCTIEDIQFWNNINNTTLHPGQMLEIWINENNHF